MEPVLLLTYFFPPANLPASYRVYSWARYLNEYGYYPIVITRRWDHSIKAPSDLFRKSAPEILHEKHEQYEVYFLPYFESLRDQIYLQYGENERVLLRKMLTFGQSILGNYSNLGIPYSNMYVFARNLLKQRPEIKKMIITGNPFQLFRFGYLLQREFGIKWIADFRDEWSTTDWDYMKTGKHKLTYELEKRSERKWTSTATAITTVTPYFANKLQAFHNKPATVIYNGFFEDESAPLRNRPLEKNFTFTFAGTLYDIQEIEPMLEAIKILIKEYSDRIKITVCFPGLGFEASQKARIEHIFKDQADSCEITSRISKKEILEIQARSHVLLLPSMGNLKGNIQSKLFDYISLHKRVLLYPSDNDILEEILIETGLGIIPRSKEELYEELKKLLDEYIEKGSIIAHPNVEAIERYSRYEQSKKLGGILNTL
jgi:glycosyltransferase involved in cell wall biosynthesis